MHSTNFRVVSRLNIFRSIFFITFFLLGLPCFAQTGIEELLHVFRKSENMDSIFNEYYKQNPSMVWADFAQKSQELIKEDSIKIYFLISISSQLDKKDPQAGLSLLDDCEKLAKLAGNPVWLAETYGNKSYMLTYSGKYTEAVEVLSQALGLIDKKNHIATYAGLLADLARTYDYMEDYASSRKYFEESNKLFEEVGDERNLLINTFNIGGLYMNMENNDSAIMFFERAIQKAPEFFPMIEAYSYGNIGQVLVNKGEYRAAIQSQLKGLRIEQEFNDELSTMDSHAVLGSAYAHLNNRDSTFYHFERSISLAIKHKTLDKLLGFYEVQSEALAHLNEYKAAFDASENLRLLNDSIRALKVQRTQLELKEKYETEQKEAQNQLLLAENEKQKLFLFAVLAVLIISIIGIWYIYNIHKKTKILNEKISAQAFALKQSNSTKDRLFSIIGHDLRGPITSFETATSIIKSYLDKKDLSKIDEMIQYADQSAKNLKQLLNNLLSWSLSQENEIKLDIRPIRLKPLIDEVLEIYAETSNVKGINIISSIKDEKVLGDYDTLSTAIRNLISNALKFSHQGSEINVSQNKSDQFIELIIEDSGVGIPKKNIDKLYSIDKSKVRKGTAKEKGTGLGLVLVKEFVEMNNGKLKLTSQEGKGTIFYISLPIAS